MDLDVICGKDNSRCTSSPDGSIIYKGDERILTLNQALDPKINKEASKLYGPTGGFQAIQGGWYLPAGFTISYAPGGVSDAVVESFSGTHDFIGGELPRWYDNQGNTSRGRTTVEKIGSTATTILAIPLAAPFALVDLVSPDFMQVIMKLKGK